jgi:hypothetical protein
MADTTHDGGLVGQIKEKVGGLSLYLGTSSTSIMSLTPFWISCVIWSTTWFLITLPICLLETHGRMDRWNGCE